MKGMGRKEGHREREDNVGDGGEIDGENEECLGVLLDEKEDEGDTREKGLFQGITQKRKFK